MFGYRQYYGDTYIHISKWKQKNMRNTNGVWATVYGCPYPWTAGAMILKYNDFYIYIHQSKMETKKYTEHKRRA